jgi:hypothetical protein
MNILEVQDWKVNIQIDMDIQKMCDSHTPSIDY